MTEVPEHIAEVDVVPRDGRALLAAILAAVPAAPAGTHARRAGLPDR